MAAKAANNTAPPAISLMKPILYGIPDEQITNFSTAVFKPSTARTNPVAKICIIHSTREILK